MIPFRPSPEGDLGFVRPQRRRGRRDLLSCVHGVAAASEIFFRASTALPRPARSSFVRPRRRRGRRDLLLAFPSLTVRVRKKIRPFLATPEVDERRFVLSR
jgi:hypothetical protein